MSWTYLNSGFFPSEEVTISPFDRGFLFADSVYEVIPSYNGTLALFEEHRSRLLRSLRETDIPKPEKWDSIEEIIRRLVKKNRFKNQSIYLQISRGKENERSHIPRIKTTPTLFITSSKLSMNPYITNINKYGLKVCTHEDIRWKRCDIKSSALLGNIMLLRKVNALGFDNVILHINEKVTETASSNIFAVFNEEIVTTPLNENLLAGVTRQHLIQILKELNMNISEKEFRLQDLYKANEVWLTSSTQEIQPVAEINKKKLNTPKPQDSLWLKALKAYQKEFI